MTDVCQTLLEERNGNLLLTMAIMYRNQLVELQAVASAGAVHKLEDLGLAYRSTNTQLWMYSRLTDKGVALFNQLIATLQSRL